MFPYQTNSPNSVIKFLSDLYSCQRTANLLYTNDAKVLIDIIVRQLNDLSPGDQVLCCFTVVIVMYCYYCTSISSSRTVSEVSVASFSGCSMHSSVHCRWQAYFLLQSLVCGTIFHGTSLLPPLSPSSAVVLNHISSHFLIPLPDCLSFVQCPHSDSLFWTH